MGADAHNLWDGGGDDSSDGEGFGMIKPIVPGCLALFKGAITGYGDILPACGVRVGFGPRHKAEGDLCRHCGTNDKYFECRGLPLGYAATCACRLTRIDGHDPDAITETDKELTV